MANCRLNPTTNGGFHLGHIAMALINEHEAHSTGGKFLVRFEDNSPQWTSKQQPGEARGYAHQMIRDLEFMGIDVDEYSYQSKMVGAMELQFMMLKWEAQRSFRSFLKTTPAGLSQAYAPEVPTDPSSQYPFAPVLTREKVILDYMQGIDLLIRGFDLLGEYSLYCYIADMWSLPIPRQIFLPRLQLSEGVPFTSPVDVSKTNARCKVADLRKSLTAESIREILALAYLKDPGGAWLAKNVKANPVLKGIDNE